MQQAPLGCGCIIRCMGLRNKTKTKDYVNQAWQNPALCIIRHKSHALQITLFPCLCALTCILSMYSSHLFPESQPKGSRTDQGADQKQIFKAPLRDTGKRLLFPMFALMLTGPLGHSRAHMTRVLGFVVSCPSAADPSCVRSWGVFIMFTFILLSSHL